jgi:hypothetical protein
VDPPESIDVCISEMGSRRLENSRVHMYAPECTNWSRRSEKDRGVYMGAPECTDQNRRLEHSGGVHVNAQVSVDVHLFFFFFLTMFIPGQYLSTRPVTVETAFVIV